MASDPSIQVKECNQCGKCCIKYSHGGLSASSSEIEFWEIYRPVIYSYVQNGEIWADPDTRQPLERCPWLKQLPGQDVYLCEIYYDRPDDCKYYPINIEQMLADGCEMLEARDLKRPSHAQKTLDLLMSESRPPFE